MKAIKLIIAIAVSLFSYSDTVAQEVGNSKITENKEYTCTMHPEIISNSPEFCPKCGMKLVEKGSKVNSDKVAPTYTCSMHPEVVSDTSGKCPKCGMNLINKEENSSSGMGCMGMMSGGKKHKGGMYVVGGALMIGMMAVIMVFAAR